MKKRKDNKRGKKLKLKRRPAKKRARKLTPEQQLYNYCCIYT